MTRLSPQSMSDQAKNSQTLHVFWGELGGCPATLEVQYSIHGIVMVLGFLCCLLVKAFKEGKKLPPKGTPYVWSLESWSIKSTAASFSADIVQSVDGRANFLEFWGLRTVRKLWEWSSGSLLFLRFPVETCEISAPSGESEATANSASAARRVWYLRALSTRRGETGGVINCRL